MAIVELNPLRHHFFPPQLYGFASQTPPSLYSVSDWLTRVAGIPRTTLPRLHAGRTPGRTADEETRG